MTLARALIETPVGMMRALATDRALCAFEFHVEGRMARLDARLARWFDAPEFVDEDNAVIAATRAWADRYFSGISAISPR